MISPRVKLIVGIVVVAAALVFSLVLASQLGTSGQTGANRVAPWTPPATFTSSPTATIPHGLDNTPTPLPAPTSTFDPLKNCTRSLRYWATHTAEWPASVTIGGYVYTKAAAIAAIGHTTDTAANLLVQLNAAYLNASSGADYTAVKDSILAAANWLIAHPQDSPTPDPSDLQVALALQIALADFNEGRAGPGLCIDTPTPTDTSTPGLTQKPTSASTGTPLPTWTSLPGKTATATPTIKPTSPPRPTQPGPKPSPRPTLAPSTPVAHPQAPSPIAEAKRFSPPKL